MQLHYLENTVQSTSICQSAVNENQEGIRPSYNNSPNPQKCCVLYYNRWRTLYIERFCESVGFNWNTLTTIYNNIGVNTHLNVTWDSANPNIYVTICLRVETFSVGQPDIPYPLIRIKRLMDRAKKLSLCAMGEQGWTFIRKERRSRLYFFHKIASGINTNRKSIPTNLIWLINACFV
jgi:hypothetical protein